MPANLPGGSSLARAKFYKGNLGFLWARHPLGKILAGRVALPIWHGWPSLFSAGQAGQSVPDAVSAPEPQ